MSKLRDNPATDQTTPGHPDAIPAPKIRRLPVIDDKKRMVGMLSLGDVSHSASRELSGELMAAVSAHHK
jgi:CBS domain-containing protein